MKRRWAFLGSSASDGAGHTSVRIGGELAIWARTARRKLVFGRFGPDHDAVMRIGGEAPGGGPILSVGIKC